MKAEVEAFIKIVSTYDYNISMIKRLQEEYDLVFYDLCNVKSISFEPVARCTNELQKEMRKHDLRDKLEKIKNEIKLYQMINDYVDAIVEEIEQPIKDAIFDIYCKKKSYEKIAKKNNYSKAGLYFKIQNEIESALEKAHI